MHIGDLSNILPIYNNCGSYKYLMSTDCEYAGP